jgi:hypothetical protein
MKTFFFTLSVALFATMALNAQQISVVSPAGATTLYTDLNLAIQGAASGSTVYLSGGGFQVNDTTKMTKRLTIIGIGHRPNNDNADGSTIVSGNLFFEGGSDNSSLMGLYVSGNVIIGTGENAVNTILVRYCNVNSIQVLNSNCQGVVINQNYIRGNSSCGNSPVTFSNNILNGIYSVKSGIINHNVIRGSLGYYIHNNNCAGEILDCQIKNNIFFFINYWWTTNCVWDSNMGLQNVGGDNTNAVVVENWDNVFEGTYSGVNVNDNYALKPGAPGKNAATDGSDIGIYGGTGFSDTALPPGPRIIRKVIADQTDENGNLRVQVEVKVGD